MIKRNTIVGFPHSVFAFFLTALIAVGAFGQAESGSSAIEGTVVDINGSSVSGASVTIRNLETGLERVVVTDRNGRFSARVLPVGRYLVVASASGFAEGRRENVMLRVGESTPVSVSLRPSEVTAQVDIVSGTDLIDTETSTTGASLGERLVADLPVRGRNFSEFITLTPAVIQEADRSGLVVAGQRSINSNIAVDGADFNDPVQGNQRGGNESVFFFPQSAVREFQVVRSGASAEIGRTNAGFVNVVTKSGSNDLRGEVFYNNRNRYLTSEDAFGRSLDNAQNQFGGAIGGPIVRDRAFFFFSLEQNLLRVPFVVEFQDVPGVQIPSELAALEGEKRGTNNPTVLFGRTDYLLNNSNTLNLQYTYTRMRGENFDFDSPRQTTAESGNYMRKGSSNGLKGSLVTVFSPNIINEIRGQVATDNRLEQPNSNMPRINIAGFGDIGGNDGRPRQFDSTRYQFANNVSISAGRHQLRFGFETNINNVAQRRETRIQGRWDFENRVLEGVPTTGLEQYIAGRPRRFRQTLATNDQNLSLFQGTQQEYALFIQDRIRVSNQFVIDAGFRWEAQINPQPTDPFPGIPETSRIPNDLKQFQPRLGMAYDVNGRGNTVIRFSAGIFTARTPANLFQRVFTNNGSTTREIEIAEPGACRNSSIVNRPGCRLRGPDAIFTFPNSLTSIPPAFESFALLPRVFGFDPTFRNPRSFQAAATLEQKISRDIVMSIGYIRNSTWALQRRLNRNLFPPTIDSTGMPIFPAARPIPGISWLSINESTAHSTYDGMTFTMTRRFADRFQFQANYTLSKSMDDDSNERNFSQEPALNPFDLSIERGYSKQDVRHNINLSGLVDLGYGFTLSGVLITRSGFPYTPVIGFDTQNDGNDDNDRAIINGRVVDRNSFRQPGFFNLDLRLLKGFILKERMRLDLSAELFNVTRNSNRNFGNDAVSFFGTPLPDGSPSEPNAGVPLFAPSTARFGGPRQLQLGVRFVF
ncbi:MAG TPA: carboxypeptidase regulatory-like domain-containing protein [Pyrinomonadaceae bacterium]|nr:carboxypeptidase regulatory-like domain-containing protein [Pyrinomonadaceae bacterium]HMP64373.1 carboxypeptidase regulatory-like domain-containing protein [Pyrinomonadaceae bacterium]